MSWAFFTDRDLGKQFPEILRASGLEIRRHGDLFAPECPDEEWLEDVGRRGWVAITHDQRIRYKPNELAAVVRHRVMLLVVIGKVPFSELARNFVATFPKVEAFLAVHPPPFIAKVYRPAAARLVRNPAAPGNVELWYPQK